MTDQKPNCSTCPHKEEVMNYGFGRSRPRCEITKWFLDACSPTTVEHDFIDKVGCMSHPQAREYLMKDVLEELEREKTVNRINGNVWCNGYDDALKLAIALVKGVKK